MPVTVPITVYVPDVIVERISIAGDDILAEQLMGKPTESWTNIQLKEEARRLLDEWGRNYNSEEKQRMYDALMLIMRQEKRALPEAALNEFLTTSNRPNDIAAFVQKYGLFKRPDRVEKPLKVSIEKFRKVGKGLRSLLGVWTPLREVTIKGIGTATGFQFSTDPRSHSL